MEYRGKITKDCVTAQQIMDLNVISFNPSCISFFGTNSLNYCGQIRIVLNHSNSYLAAWLCSGTSPPFCVRSQQNIGRADTQNIHRTSVITKRDSEYVRKKGEDEDVKQH